MFCWMFTFALDNSEKNKGRMGCKAGAPGTAVVLFKECPILLPGCQLLLLIFLLPNFFLSPSALKG